MQALRRTLRRAIALAVVAVTAATATSPDAGAKYTAAGTGTASAKATTLAAPVAPTVASTGLLAVVYCRVRVTWPAPPAGQTYTLRRSILGTSTLLRTALSATGSFNDDILLTALLGAPTYTLTASLNAPGVWTSAPSVTTSGAGCLTLL